MDYAQILPRLFIGSHPRTVDDIDRLRLKAGITAVLNLHTDEDMRAVNLTWEPLEAHYTAFDIELLRVPVRDRRSLKEWPAPHKGIAHAV